MIELYMHHDYGHGWLEVPMDLIEHCKLQRKISLYSYQSFSGATAYLEEDCDASLLIHELDVLNMDYKIIHEHAKGSQDSFVRSRPRFVARKNIEDYFITTIPMVAL